jgi:hypothetical protein
MDSEEKGAEEVEQGTQPKTPEPQKDSPVTAEAQCSTINSERKREEDTQSDAFIEFNPLEDDEKIEMDSEVNSTFSEQDTSKSSIGGAHVKAIIGHNWIAGRLKTKVKWNTKQTSWEELKDMKEDYPQMTARYLVDAEVTTRSQRGDRMQAWATKTLRDISRTARRMARIYDFHLDNNKEVYSVRRTA